MEMIVLKGSETAALGFLTEFWSFLVGGERMVQRKNFLPSCWERERERKTMRRPRTKRRTSAWDSLAWDSGTFRSKWFSVWASLPGWNRGLDLVKRNL